MLGAALLLVYTVVKFYLLKPNHVPQPEKEHIRVGSPLGSATGAHLLHVFQSLWTYFHSHDRDTGTPPGSSWRKYSKSWRRRRFEGWREICWRREQRGEERKVNLLLSQKMQSMVFFQSDEQNSVFYLKVEEHLFNCHCKLSIQGTKTFVRRKITFVKEFALNF